MSGFASRTMLRQFDALRDLRAKKGSYKAVLLDTPIHGNLGDQAIALAERRFLDALYGQDEYCELTANDIDRLEGAFANVIPYSCCVFVHGGGFLGDLWINEEKRFRRILRAFKNHRVIVLPQTVSFDIASKEGRKRLLESQKIYSSHPNVTICVREKMSFEFMQNYFPKVDVVLAPDMVLSLEVHHREEQGDRKGTFFCMRSDKEKILSNEDQCVIERAVENRNILAPITWSDTVIYEDVEPAMREQKVAEILDEFSRVKLVVTDRLHGMVFAVLAGTPCIALGNCSGKVEAVYKWIEPFEYVRYVSRASEVPTALDAVLSRGPGLFDRCRYWDKLMQIIPNLLQE